MIRMLRKNPIVDLLVTVVTAIVIAYCIQAWFVKPFSVPSGSMIPTLEVSDHILAARFLFHFTDPERGDILVFHPNGVGEDVRDIPSVADPYYVKRLIGLPGEFIGSTRAKVWVCSKVAPTNLDAPETTPGCRYLDEPYTHGLASGRCQASDAPFGPIKILPDHYFMMGDNRTSSSDSRCWGQIPRSSIIGRSFMTYWPLTRISFY